MFKRDYGRTPAKARSQYQHIIRRLKIVLSEDQIDFEPHKGIFAASTETLEALNKITEVIGVDPKRQPKDSFAAMGILSKPLDLPTAYRRTMQKDYPNVRGEQASGGTSRNWLG